jgi:hypothetical protein
VRTAALSTIPSEILGKKIVGLPCVVYPYVREPQAFDDRVLTAEPPTCFVILPQIL